MELASVPQPQREDVPSGETPAQAANPVNTEKRRKTRSKDSPPVTQRRVKRRRTAAGGEDLNVNFSKLKICESNRVLRSRVKRSSSATIETYCDAPNCSQSDAVSKDHSYSKASKRLTKQKDHPLNTPTVHLKVFIDLTSSEDNSYDRFEGTTKDVDVALPVGSGYRRNNKIEIIDFDDLELSNSCYDDHGAKCDRNANDPSVENRNLTVTTENHRNELFVEARDGGSNDEDTLREPSDQPAPADDPEQNFNPKTDFEKLLAKYGDADLYLTRNTSFLEQSHWMLESAINPSSVIEKPIIGPEDASQSPIYLDLDQNRIRVSSPQSLAMITQPVAGEIVSIAGPMNFPSGGCFQRLGTMVTSTLTRPAATESEYYNGIAPSCLPNGLTFAAHSEVEDSRLHHEIPGLASAYDSPGIVSPATSPLGRSTLSGFPNFQTVFAHKIASLIRSKPSSSQPITDTILGHHSFGRPPIPTTTVITSNFSTSGGSIERIYSPVIPKQPATLKKYSGTSVPFPEKDTSTPSLAPEAAHFDSQNGQQPECRIHLVDTPPSFTRTSQPEATQLISRPPSNGGQSFIGLHQQSPSESNRLSACKASIKPKRTRRTRAQMEIYRQEMARSCNHRSKRSQRFSSRTASHIVGRNFSMEYRRVHNHPQEFLYSALPSRFPPYMRPPGLQQQRYSETYSVNETNLYGVSSNSADWPQSFDHFPSFSHGLTEFRSFEPLWTMSPGIRNVNAFASTEAGLRMNTTENYQEFHEPTLGNLQNPASSFMWNQQVRSIQLQSAAYGNVQQVPAGNSRIIPATRRPFTPWHQPLSSSIEQMSSNLTDVSANGSINQMPFY